MWALIRWKRQEVCEKIAGSQWMQNLSKMAYGRYNFVHYILYRNFTARTDNTTTCTDVDVITTSKSTVNRCLLFSNHLRTPDVKTSLKVKWHFSWVSIFCMQQGALPQFLDHKVVPFTFNFDPCASSVSINFCFGFFF